MSNVSTWATGPWDANLDPIWRICLSGLRQVSSNFTWDGMVSMAAHVGASISFNRLRCRWLVTYEYPCNSLSRAGGQAAANKLSPTHFKATKKHPNFQVEPSLNGAVPVVFRVTPWHATLLKISSYSISWPIPTQQSAAKTLLAVWTLKILHSQPWDDTKRDSYYVPKDPQDSLPRLSSGI